MTSSMTSQFKPNEKYKLKSDERKKMGGGGVKLQQGRKKGKEVGG